MTTLWELDPPALTRARRAHSSNLVRRAVSFAVASYLVLPLPIAIFSSLVALLLLAIERSQACTLAARRPIG